MIAGLLFDMMWNDLSFGGTVVLESKARLKIRLNCIDYYYSGLIAELRTMMVFFDHPGRFKRILKERKRKRRR